ncbi:hypothetical protein [Mangrovitalea sediminis]|uniref:hypothetical protein n=1 Tax=Mangrovitalea sediminis TaxID=1982043 RepID=UPI000BE4CCD7|nr:hypothetical protein [Mangrovitalea sediminis]
MFQVLEDDIGIHMIGSVVEEDIPLRVKYANGQLIPADEQPRGLKVVLEEGPDSLPDLFVLGGNPIASERLVDALKHAGVHNIEYFPAPIERPDETVTGYGILNIVGLVDCIDRRKSQYTSFAGQMFRMQHLELDESAIGDLLLFRPAGYTLLMLIHESVAGALAGLSGVLLPPATGWSDSHRF